MILPLLLALAAPATQPSAPQAALAPDAAEIPVVTAGPAKGVREGGLEPLVLIDGPMPTSFDVADDGAIFAAFPRWRDPVNYAVARIDPESAELTPFPDAETNAYYPSEPQRNDPAEHFVCVQAVRLDRRGRLWVLDTGAVNLGTVVPGGAKLWAYDPASGERLEAFTFDVGDGEPVRTRSYLNDVRFSDTHAFITDSGEGAIVVVDLETGEAWRKLEDAAATAADKNVELKAEGEPLLLRPPGTDETKPFVVKADGVAIDAEGGRLFVTPLTGRGLYGVPLDLLSDRDHPTSYGDVTVVTKSMASANDGIAFHDGGVYTTDFEDNALRRIDAETGEQAVVVRDERLIWPDGVVVRGGRGYVSVNQLNRQPQFHRGEDRREGPYGFFTFPAE